MQNILYLEVDSICAVILFLVYLLGTDRKIISKSRTLYNALSFAVICVLLADGAGWMLDSCQGKTAGVFLRLFTFICDFFCCIVCFLWMWYTMLWLKASSVLTHRKICLWAIPAAIGIIGLFFNIPFHFLYYIDTNNIYHRGALFCTIYIISLFYISSSFLYSIFEAIHVKAIDERKKDMFIAVILFPPSAGALLQARFYGVILIWPIMTASLIALYFKLQARKEAEDILTIEHMKYEIKERDISIMLSQIQPHFLFNALTTIKGLTMVDTDKACEAIDDFSSFLRGNIDSLSAHGLIPFTKELDHTKQYLALEQMRFGTRLSVVYSLQTTSFSIPPLTLQPIVENAVRYGITKKEDGGTVSIMTKQKNGNIEVIIFDDGIGFDPMKKKEDGRSHIGIQNVRDRIIMQCKGNLVITSTPGTGTVVVMTIPETSQV